MTVLILASTTDPASANIAGILVRNFGLREVELSGERVRCKKDDIILTYIEADIPSIRGLEVDCCIESVICLSRHSSESGRPTLTAHAPGNLGPQAESGGVPRTLAWADPHRLRSALIELHESSSQARLGYSVSLEATHHGPTGLQKPVTFIEIGSTPEQWLSLKAGEAAAAAAIKAAKERSLGTAAVGFGGGHYSPRHTAAVISGGLAIGHIIPEYFFEDYDPRVVEQAFSKTVGECRTAAIDWKGLKSDARKRLISTLEGLGVGWVRV
ncbi:MAG: D-aminoacyl-tRNA deacylase [Candidatus Bathyarchaeia archaeon]